jgi:7,8-dihydroneopterin aldolase/epimerase/oxygenase
MSSIFIENLVLSTVIGVYDHEQTTPQPLRFDIEMGLASDASFTSDKLRDTIDYAEVAKRVAQELAANRFYLLERCAGYLGPALAAHFGARWIKIKIAKVGVVPGAQAVGVVYEYRV